jgi:hypothetical protein
MADNNKVHAEWIDIPDGSGGTQRIWYKDAEARAAIDELPSAASVQTCEDIIDELI